MAIELTSTVEVARQTNIALARDYYNGEHGVELTSRLKQFIKTDVPFRMNVCQSVINAIAERLQVIGFDSTNAELAQWAMDLWTRNKMASFQEELYEKALNEGESFIIVDWYDAEQISEERGTKVSSDSSRVTWTLHPRFVAKAQGGDDYGCWMVYVEDDPHQEALYGVKSWTKAGEGGQVLYYKNEYYPDRIVKYQKDAYSDWSQVEVIPWVGPDGEPMGIAVVPFNNKGCRLEAWDAIPLQDALNKTLVDLLTSSDQTAFRIYYALGFIPTEDGKPPAADGSNLMRIEPGTIVSTTKARRDADFGAIDPAQIQPLMDLAHQMVLWIAMVTSTPVSRFISTRLVASDATLKEQEGPLISRVKSRQNAFGDSWLACLELSRKLYNMFAEGSQVSLDEALAVMWAEAASRGELEKLTILKDKKDIGIPEEQLWIEDGYDTATIEKMKAMKEGERDASTINTPNAGPGSNGLGTENGAGDGTENGTDGNGVASDANIGAEGRTEES